MKPVANINLKTPSLLSGFTCCVKAVRVMCREEGVEVTHTSHGL